MISDTITLVWRHCTVAIKRLFEAKGRRHFITSYNIHLRNKDIFYGWLNFKLRGLQCWSKRSMRCSSVLTKCHMYFLVTWLSTIYMYGNNLTNCYQCYGCPILSVRLIQSLSTTSVCMGTKLSYRNGYRCLYTWWCHSISRCSTDSQSNTWRFFKKNSNGSDYIFAE